MMSDRELILRWRAARARLTTVEELRDAYGQLAEAALAYPGDVLAAAAAADVLERLEERETFDGVARFLIALDDRGLLEPLHPAEWSASASWWRTLRSIARLPEVGS